MASNIISETIDGAFPVQGQDNDTQGFRDNFTIIKNNFAAAKSEIETLQNNTAKVNESSNFLGNNIIDANVSQMTEQVFTTGTFDGSTATPIVSFSNGHYQKVAVADDVNITLADFPADDDRLARMTIEIVADDVQRTVTWSVESGGSIKSDSNFPANFYVTDSTNPIIVEFWTWTPADPGTPRVVYAKYLGSFS